MADDPVLPADELPVGQVALLHVGQVRHIPPAVIAVGVLLAETEPVAVLAPGAVVAEFVKIDAVGAGMVENAVQHNAHPPLPAVPAQLGKVLIRAQQGVDVPIVRGVVAVVAGGLKNGVQIQHRDPQRLEIGQLFPDAPEGAAPEGPGADAPVFRLGVKGRSVPVVDQEAMGAPAGGRLPGLPVAVTGKAVREDLVDHALLPPVGDGGVPVHGDLPFTGLLIAGLEGVPQNAGFGRGRQLQGKTVVPLADHGDDPEFARMEAEAKHHISAAEAKGGQIKGRAYLHRPKGAAEFCISGFVNNHARRLLYSSR